MLFIVSSTVSSSIFVLLTDCPFYKVCFVLTCCTYYSCPAVRHFVRGWCACFLDWSLCSFISCNLPWMKKLLWSTCACLRVVYRGVVATLGLRTVTHGAPRKLGATKFLTHPHHHRKVAASFYTASLDIACEQVYLHRIRPRAFVAQSSPRQERPWLATT